MARDLHTPWEAVVRRHPGGQTVWIADAMGREIIAWPGFDSSQCGKAERIEIARHIVACVNAAAPARRLKCTDCADGDGTCHRDGTPCDPRGVVGSQGEVFSRHTPMIDKDGRK
jgi:hypothetical protein